MRERLESGIFAKKDGYGSETDLVRGLLIDEPLAWRAFEARYGRMIDRCVDKVLRPFRNTRTEEDVAEVKANMIVELLSSDRSKLRTWRADRGSSFSSWVCMIAIHAAHDYLRVAKREPTKEEVVAALHIESGEPDPFQLTATKESIDHTRRIIGTLSDKDRQFALLYFTEGLAPEEVAERMRISVATVYTKRYKIKARLAVALASKGRAA